MKRHNTQTLGDAIKDYIRALNLESKLKEVGIINHWEELLGQRIAKATTNLYVKDKKLFVQVNSSIIRSELLMIKTEIVKRLNTKAGSEVITELIVR